MTYNKKSLKVLPWIFLFFISAFRYNVGTDFAHYNHLYIYKDGMFWYKEWGYITLVNLLSTLNFNPQMMFLFFSFCTIFLFYKSFQTLFKNYDVKFLFATLLFIPFFYFYTLNGIRQALAVAIFFYSIKYIVNKHFLKYVLLIFIAFLFHRSAIILIPLYFIFNLNLTKEKLFFIYILLFASTFFNPLEIIANLYVENQLPLYYYFNDANSMQGITGFGKILVIINIGIIIVLTNFLNKNNRLENIIFNMILFFIFIKILAMDIAFLDRFSLYFKPAMILFIILSIANVTKIIQNIKQISFIALILLSFSYTSLVIYIRGTTDESYNQYALNLYLYGKENGIVQICNNYEKVKF